jgi:hypothetical protein
VQADFRKRATHPPVEAGEVRFCALGGARAKPSARLVPRERCRRGARDDSVASRCADAWGGDRIDGGSQAALVLGRGGDCVGDPVLDPSIIVRLVDRADELVGLKGRGTSKLGTRVTLARHRRQCEERASK